MGLFWAKYARRIFAIVSTTSIPNLAPASPTEATVDPPSRGSRLDADHPENGVLIPRRFTPSIWLGSYDCGISDKCTFADESCAGVRRRGPRGIPVARRNSWRAAATRGSRPL